MLHKERVTPPFKFQIQNNSLYIKKRCETVWTIWESVTCPLRERFLQ